MPKRSESTIEYTPNPEDRVCDFLDKDSVWPENPSPILIAFKNKINWMFSACLSHGLCSGEIVQMININYGYYKRDIPWGKMEEIHEWLLNNWWRIFQLLSPKHHNALMETINDYSDDFLRHEAEIKKGKNYDEYYR
jgi:hypothetical protein